MQSLRFRQIDPGMTLREIDSEILKYWKDKNILEKILSKGGSKKFVFLEGPPTANGRPHIGHAMTRTIKDIVLRYNTMTDHKIYRRVGGWDCHGLPVELEAEKHFGFHTKSEIVNFGVEKFNQYCRESIFRYIDEWKQVDDLIGFSIDHNGDYITLRNDYMESEWFALKTMYNSGLLYKDYTVVPYCPRCETSLSSHEVAQGYKDVKDPSVYVRFKSADEENTYFVAWTTTPWTLPSNEFLVVNPDMEYSLVEAQGSRYYVASSRAGYIFKEYREIRRMHGRDLVGKRYLQLMPFLDPPSGSLKVVAGSFVTSEDGSGIVHAAPAFGADDYQIGKEEGVEILNPVDKNGRFADPRIPWNGKFVRDANEDIIVYLKKNQMLLKSEKYEHSYPFCYRCDTPLLYYPLDAWFIAVSRIRDKLVEYNERINWKPDYLKHGRFGNFLGEAKDWNLSRDRFWGTPLPAWRCKNGHLVFVGSRKEIEDLGGKVPEDLHRPYIDEVRFKCPTCGEEMSREPYVIDTWFDSGSATYAASHYPFEKNFDPETDVPVSFITEAIDQTRGWFYVLHVIATIMFNKNAYESALSINFILDAQGRKMSKSKGNSVYALDFLNEVPPDSLRLFFLYGAPWKSKNLDKKVIDEVSRKTLMTVLNVYSFFAYNANIDNFQWNGLQLSGNALDRYMVSKVNSFVRSSRDAYESLDFHEVVRASMEFVDDLSNFYLRLSRRRFWAEGFDDDKLSAYSTLYYALKAFSEVMAPITPFFSDFIYLNLGGDKESVHLEAFPEFDSTLMDEKLESEMDRAYSVIETVRRLRQENSIKGRQPLREILIAGDMEESIIDVVKSELNAKDIKLIERDQEPIRLSADLRMDRAAPVLRSRVNAVRHKIRSMDGLEVQRQISEKGFVEIDGVRLDPDMVEISRVPDPNYAYSQTEKYGIDVFINKNIDRDGYLEGLARELVRRIQVMRKEMNLNYTDRIITHLDLSDDFLEALNKHAEYIKNETQSDSIITDKVEGMKLWEINGEPVRIKIDLAR
ncbi:isoleucine--tRNA ligase [Thermoplasma acidophilum]|uniref:Isoleucine--tRNA ligase n=1 Tax=Thermoplasma acidophilum (strain ATCC 25905 / DSM 1728 / JCM 9062 / NBRC 15155 / AMRC-C165) TaxID=273075 RepID=SYI_THEAC|nr:isoleucine--tRNA ligase [Thermoplasma acidophilum]Q9HJT4.2 RecName: Full=Isoleucine--tRNA ligase; AltName: Full=Isoleucyl-tRNA synthetase; Short=IleRS [Thermoplasma acidophilum DSM 1728]